MSNEIRKYWKAQIGKKRSDMVPVIPPFECADGFQMSVQAGEFHYCSPRQMIKSGDYASWEIGFPSAKEELLMPFAEDAEKPTDTVYGYVPTNIVNQVIRAHGGIKGPRAALSKARGQS